MNFKEFSFHPAVAEGVGKAGFLQPTPIQEQALPEVMNGRDVMGLAQTGTGKTAAFVLPILDRLVDCPRGRVGALIIAPTRELAEQIHKAVKALGSKTNLRSAAVYGGVKINPQIKALARTEIVVACPGRLLDHIRRKTVDFGNLKVLVIDEADQMFDMGFLPDIRRILHHLPPKNVQTLLFSATMPEDLLHLGKDILHDPVNIQVGASAPAATVSHTLFPVSPHLKTALLIKLLSGTPAKSVLVFARTKFRAKKLGAKLSRAGYRSTSLQGDLSQGRRQEALNSFRSGKIQILVATDIAARGIDVSDVSHVINFDIPATPEAYIHRIGRTGRAERNGQAFTLITKEDAGMVKAINKVIGGRVDCRTLPDFNYDKPFTQTVKKAPSPVSHSQPGRRNRFPKTKAGGRSRKGAFACFSPKMV